MFRRLFYGVCLLFIGITNNSCTSDYLEPKTVVSGKGFKLSVGGPVVYSAKGELIVSDMRLYCFAQSGNILPGGSGNPSSIYHHIVTGLTRSGMSLTTQQMRTGLWDMVLVTPQGGILNSPEVAMPAENQLMYSYTPVIEDISGKSSDAHQVYYRYMRLPEITPDSDNTVSTGVSRNVAKVCIVVERAVDVDPASGAHTITLNKVPSKLSWAGTVLKTSSPGAYVPDVTNPDVTSVTGKVSFASTAESGVFKSDTLEFVIPAYRGSDYWNSDQMTQNPNPVDTLKCKMNLSVSFARGGGRGVFEKKNVEIPVVARCNDILVVRVKMQDVNVEVNTSVKPWDEEEVDGNVKTPFLNVSETTTSVYDGAVSRIYFWSNQPSDSVYVTIEGRNEDDSLIEDINTIFDRLAGTLAANRNYVYINKNGEGYIDIAHANTSAEGTAVRKIYLNAGGLKSEISVNSVITPQAAKNISIPYVGTFHRHDEVGERIITWANSGDWTATVEGASASDVLIDRLSSPAFSMADNSRLYAGTDSENSSVVEASRVSDMGSSTVSGRGRVYFRIGWRSSIPSSQVRYARVKVAGTDVGGLGIHVTYVYLRQGDTNDYVMRPQDRNGSGGTVEAGDGNLYRKYAIRFSPYNLTSPGNPTLSGTPLAVEGGRFTSYPSQAGAIFQWATQKVNYAYDPSPSSVTGWSNSYYSDSFWGSLSKTHESCPPGYRRPNDGSTTATSGGGIAGSEVRQSLFLNPQSDQGINTDNSAWGYLADGYFDRKMITNSASGVANSAVASSSSNVAYIGRLFYNPATNASLFVPAAGTRSEVDGRLQLAGSSVAFWTSSLYALGTPPQVWAINAGNLSVQVNRIPSGAGMSIRCVENTFEVSPSSIWLSPTAGNTTRTITISSKAGWTATNIPASVTMSQTSGGPGVVTVTLMRKNGGYGLTELQILDQATGATHPVSIDNLALISSVTEMQIPGTGVTDALETGINAYGKTGQWEVRSKPDWITISYDTGGMLYSVQPEENEQDRNGTIVLCHADDDNLTVSIDINQSANYIQFPEFNYMVVKVKHAAANKTLDFRMEIMDTGISGIDGKPIGYDYGMAGSGYNMSYNGFLLLNWAGDSFSSDFSYMTSLVNMWNMTNTSINNEFAPGKRYFSVDIYATWYSSAAPADPSSVDVGLDIILYKGGSMVSQNYDFVNNGGTLMLNENYMGFRVPSISSTKIDYDNYRTHATKLGTIIYDRFKNTATFERFASPFGESGFRSITAPRPATDDTRAVPINRVNTVKR